MRSNDQDLLVLFEKVNRDYFDGLLEIRGIFWCSDKKLNKGRRPSKKIWAQCLREARIIRINQVLLNLAPQYVIKHLIYHECLHFFWITHCAKFNYFERQFKHFKEADRWLAQHEYLI